jgi:hypothetical protein
MNDAGHVSVGLSIKPPIFWDGTAWRRIRLPEPPELYNAWGINNRDEVIVLRDADGEVGVKSRGRITWLVRQAWAARCINDRGQIAGEMDAIVSQRDRVLPFLWERGDLMFLMAPTSGTAFLSAMNNHGQMVGSYHYHKGSPGDPRDEAIIWPSSGAAMIYLNSLLPKGSPWYLATAVSINDHGQIVGRAQYNGQSCGYLATVSWH